ncbi:DUF3367 domain-containing protein [Kribbella antibiotica]|uniref:DUF3367 domain-containing protein n=1 Tax=Kribbella antibiotica TaxID=190195 RepID=A0A4V2YPQ9_9ACTN|nr:DUF3367 domain-containing protein [Kribbella antibiotica]
MLKAGTSEQVVWRARLVLGCLLLSALCFHRAPGPVAPGSRIDDPGALLSGALHLWDPNSGLGQLQSQAFGYLLPVGPFQWLMHAMSMPDWIGQRLWWCVVLCVAFLGVWKLANAWRYGVPWTRFAVALLYALSPLLLSGMSITSVEVWPLAMAPWVLLPLVTPRARSGWWRAGWSAMAFALIGGADPVAAGLTLVLPIVWLLTRRHDRWTLKMAVGWLGCVLAVSVWWLVPLLLVVQYGTPADRTAAFAQPRTDTNEVDSAQWRAWIDKQNTSGNVLVVPAVKAQWLDDEVERRLASGVGDRSFQQMLAHAGVRYLVIRNDRAAGVPPAAAVHETLGEAGLKRVAHFGTAIGDYPSVEIYDAGTASVARLIPESRLVEVRGTTSDVPAVLSALGGDREAITSVDVSGAQAELPLIQSDGLQRRELGVDQPAGSRAERVDVPAASRQPSALVLRNPQIGRSACLHLDSRSLCAPAPARDADEPGGLLRTVDLPRTASYWLNGTALPQDGPALERLLAGPIGVSASSRAVAAPEGRPGVVVDQDITTTWVADAADRKPTLTLSLPSARKLTGFQFRTQLASSAGTPTEVTLGFDGGPATVYKPDADGYVRFVERTARIVEFGFAPTAKPVAVSEIRVVGADELRQALRLDDKVGQSCGSGPVVKVDGEPTMTQVTATMRDLLQRRPVAFTTCDPGPVVLQTGRHEVDVLTNGGLVPTEVTLTKAGFGDVSVTPVQGVNLWRPNPAVLTLEVPATSKQSVLTVAQNYNEGWVAYDGTGRELTPIRVAGWQQGWVLPPGEEQLVNARFMPDRAYRAGLLVGSAAVLAVMAMAVFYRRRTRSGHQLKAARWCSSWLQRARWTRAAS